MEAFIYDHVRTPCGRGRPDGAFRDIAAVELASQVLAAIRDRNALDTVLLDDVALGCAQPVGEQGGNIARAALLRAGFSQSVAGQQINRFCASSLEAVNAVSAQIMAGQAQAGIGGGVEAMSRTPLGADSGAWAGDPQIMYHSDFAPQGIGADLIATIDGYSREDVDRYAFESQSRAATAWREGRFAGSIAPVKDSLGNIVIDRDEHLRPDTTVEALGTLKPAFAGLGEKMGFNAIALRRYPHVEAVIHVHTSGNSSGIVDGAAAVLLGSEAFGVAAGLKPRARIAGFASIGSEPTIMLTAPAGVTRKLLDRLGMEVADIDLFELNEAFSSVVLRYMRELGIDRDHINVNGGAIAMGHPMGATGAMLLGTALDELERRNARTALITLCAANGLGTATLIERI